jgi:hypothetical protein
MFSGGGTGYLSGAAGLGTGTRTGGGRAAGARAGTGTSEGAEVLSKRGAIEAQRLSPLGGISTVGPYWGGEASAPRSYKPPLATPTLLPHPKGGVSVPSPVGTPQGAPIRPGCSRSNAGCNHVMSM